MELGVSKDLPFFESATGKTGSLYNVAKNTDYTEKCFKQEFGKMKSTKNLVNAHFLSPLGVELGDSKGSPFFKSGNGRTGSF